MNIMTGRERLFATFMGEKPDRVPVSLPFGPYGTKLTGITLDEFNFDAQKRVACYLACYEAFRPDLVAGILDPLMFAEAVGLTVEFVDGGYFVPEYPLKKKSGLENLRPVSPSDNPRVPYFLEVCRTLASELSDNVVSATIGGPWTLAMHLRGMEQLIYDTVDAPPFVHELLRFTTEIVKEYLETVRQAGVGINLADPSAGCSVISPSIYREFAQPYEAEVINHFKEQGTFLSLHICGLTDPIMADMVATGARGISIDGPASLEKLVQCAADDTIVIGNVPTELFLQGTKQEVEAAVKRCLATAAPRGHYILCSGCQIPLQASPERVKQFTDAAVAFG